MQYISKTQVLGLPLVHINTGYNENGRHHRGVAKGWFALGDVAFGLLALGGMAFGGIAFGGLGLGVFCLAGLAGGIWAVGGVAVGVYAAAGLAIGASAALGGLAIAGGKAYAGAAFAPLANTPEVEAWFSQRPFFGTVLTAMPYARYGIVLALLPAVMAWWKKRGAKRK